MPWAMHITMLLSLLFCKRKGHVIFHKSDVDHFRIQTVLRSFHQIPIQKKNEVVQYVTFVSTSEQMLCYQLIYFLFHISFPLCELESKVLLCSGNVTRQSSDVNRQLPRIRHRDPTCCVHPSNCTTNTGVLRFRLIHIDTDFIL